MKILSFCDIITNSSTEVFTIYSNSAEESIKNIVNAVLTAAGVRTCFDNLFEFSYDYSEEFLEDEFGENKDTIKRDAIEADRNWVEDQSGVDYLDRPIRGIKIIAKNNASQDCADIISKIDRIFEHEAIYC